MCLFVCLCLSICLSIYVCLPVFLSLCLSVCLLSVDRQCSLSELSASHSVREACRQPRRGCWERERNATHTRATAWAAECWAKDRGWEQGNESKKLRAEGVVYKSERLIMRLKPTCGECCGNWEPSATLPKDWAQRESAWRRVAFRNLRLTRTSERTCGLATLWFRVCVYCVCVFETRFQSSYRLSPKATWVLVSHVLWYILCPMTYVLSYVLWLMSYVPSGVWCHMFSWLWFMSCF